MNIKTLKKEDNEVTFILDKTTPAIANLIRRLVVNHVPTLAIEEVNVKKNSSALFDEMLALRLGLVPLKTDLKTYKLKEDCKCEGKGCEQCTLVLTLKVKGPGTVKAEQLVSKDPKVKSSYPELPIVKLTKDQEVDLELTAVLNYGRDHIKFSPGLAYYSGYPELKASNKAGIKAAIDATKGKIVEKGSNIEIKDILTWTEADEEICEKNGITVTYSDSKFVFTLESWGQLSPKEILVKTTDIFEKKLKEFSTQFKKLK